MGNTRNNILKGTPKKGVIYGGDGNDRLYDGQGRDKCRQVTGHGKRKSCGKDPDNKPKPDKDKDRSKKGALRVCPVRHGTVYDDFGDPRVGHKHQGNDITASKGQPVRASFPGTTQNLHASSAGSYVMLTGKHGFTYGMHLSKFAPERQVSTGDVIGYVGSTGNAGSTNHLHFEWHPKGRGAVDPFPLLRKVCRSPHTHPPRRPRTSRRRPASSGVRPC